MRTGDEFDTRVDGVESTPRVDGVHEPGRGRIITAVEEWCEDPAAAKAKYGPIASWNTSAVTSMVDLFCGKANFNEDISRWNVCM